MMKILLINCLKNDIQYLENILNKTSEEQDFSEIINTRNLPIGLMSIKSYLKSKYDMVDIEIMDINLLFINKYFYRDGNNVIKKIQQSESITTYIENEIVDIYQKFQPDIVGLSLLFDTGFYNLIETSKILKKENSDLLIIAGGHSPHNLYKTLFQNCNTIDAVCFGEGEIPWSELVGSKNKKTFLNQSPYFITKDQWAQSDFMPSQSYINNLDDIPQIDYKEIIDKYGSLSTYYPNRFMYPVNNTYNTVTFFTSRGCTFNCIFCASGSIHGHKIRFYSLDRVKMEIDYLVNVLHINILSIDDDHFLFDVERAIQIIDYIGSKHVFMEFTSSLAIYPINKKLIEAFIRNNVKVLQLSLESGCQRVLRDIIQKPLNLEKAKKVFELLETTKIFIIANIVIGFPEETEYDILETIEFLKTVNIHWLNCFSPAPISGSRLLQNALEKRYLENYDVSKTIVSNNIFVNTVISQEKLSKIRYDLNLNINFVNNYHIRHKRYSEIIHRFIGISQKYKNHAFSYYCIYECYKNIDKMEQQMEDAKSKYNNILKTNIFWKTQAERFGLPKKL